MIATQERIKQGNLVLELHNDFNYTLELIKQYKYNRLPQEMAFEILRKYCCMMWVVYRDGVKSGVVYISYYEEVGYTLDAYKDQRVQNSIRDSIRVGQRIMDYFFKNIFHTIRTMHNEKNKLATMACKKIGFTEEKRVKSGIGTFIVLKARRESWEQEQQ